MMFATLRVICVALTSVLALSESLEAQCKPIDVDTTVRTSRGRAQLGVKASSGVASNDPLHLSIYFSHLPMSDNEDGPFFRRPDPALRAALEAHMRSGVPKPFDEYAFRGFLDPANVRMLGVWVRRDSTWMSVFASVPDVDSTMIPRSFRTTLRWVAESEFDALVQWRVQGESLERCNFLRGKVSAIGYAKYTETERRLIPIDTANAAKNMGSLTVVMRDVDRPTTAVGDSGLVVLHSFRGTMTPDLMHPQSEPARDGQVVFKTLPSGRYQVFAMPRQTGYGPAWVDVIIRPGCHAVLEFYLGPGQKIDLPSPTPHRAHLTTCKQPNN